MEALKQTTTDYLLDAGIETLHQQSMEWLEDIAFWRDEAAFLYSLEIAKTSKEIPLKAKGKLDKLNNELIKMADGDLDYLYQTVENHEKYLDIILSGKIESDETYRGRHKQIAEEVRKFAARFKALKKGIFDIVKETRTNLAVEIGGHKKTK